MQVNDGRVPGFGSVRLDAGFTGEVWADPVLAGAVDVAANNVFFAPAARTHWHTHSGGQILYVTAGSGRVVSRRAGAARVRAGDVVWTEPGEEHWHGADEQNCLIHLAVTLGAHEWLDPVSDSDYAAAGEQPPRD